MNQYKVTVVAIIDGDQGEYPLWIKAENEQLALFKLGMLWGRHSWETIVSVAVEAA